MLAQPKADQKRLDSNIESKLSNNTYLNIIKILNELLNFGLILINKLKVNTLIVSIEFSPVIEIGVSKGHISPQETISRNTTFELHLTWLVFKYNQ